MIEPTIPRRPLGASGLVVSVLGFGGAPIGFAEADRRAEEGLVELVRRAADLGVTFFDTAPDYRRGEELIGRALRGRRGDVVLATKCGRLQSRRPGGWEVSEDWSEAGVLRTVEASLRRLDTDYVDLVQLHSPSAEVLEDGAALRGLQRAQRTGLVRHIGVSADGDVARRALELGAFATLQVSYSILQQEPGADLLPLAVARGVGVIAKQPIANGIPIMSRPPEHPDWSWKWDVAQRMDWSAAGERTGRLGLALRWLLADRRVATAIVGTAQPEHLEANVTAARAPDLDRPTVDRLRAAYAAARGHGEAVAS